MKFFMFLFAFILPDLLSAEVGKKVFRKKLKCGAVYFHLNSLLSQAKYPKRSLIAAIFLLSPFSLLICQKIQRIVPYHAYIEFHLL